MKSLFSTLLLFILVGCRLQESQCIGKYHLTFLSESGEFIYEHEILLKPGGIVEQSVRSYDGTVTRESGKWVISNAAIEISPFLVPVEFEGANLKPVPIHPPQISSGILVTMQGKNLALWEELGYILVKCQQ